MVFTARCDSYGGNEGMCMIDEGDVPWHCFWPFSIHHFQGGDGVRKGERDSFRVRGQIPCCR